MAFQPKGPAQTDAQQVRQKNRQAAQRSNNNNFKTNLLLRRTRNRFVSKTNRPKPASNRTNNNRYILLPIPDFRDGLFVFR